MDDTTVYLRLNAYEDKIHEALLENLCGDPDCEERRVNAAIAVLRGGAEHKEFVIVVENSLCE